MLNHIHAKSENNKKYESDVLIANFEVYLNNFRNGYFNFYLNWY